MVLSVVNEYKWPPSVIGKMYVDNYDEQGLVFWYDECVRISKELKPKK
jgi:hypothetical protein